MNKYKKIFIAFLLVAPLLLAGCSGGDKSPKNASSSAPNQQQEEAKADKVEVVYFHATRRCVACELLEKYARETIEEYFQPEIRDGKISFQSVNVELAEHKEIVGKYQARGSSLFINPSIDDQDNITEEVQGWRLLGNEQRFKEYFKNKLSELLR